jgi:hypothetical protein
VNIAERVPTITRASPRAIASHERRAFAIGEPGVQGQHRHAQARAEARQGLRRQADLRHQDQRLSAGRQAIADRLQVDLGLATAGYTLQQHGTEALALAQLAQGLGLGGVEGRRGAIRPKRRRRRLGQGSAFDPALAQQGPGRRRQSGKS